MTAEVEVFHWNPRARLFRGRLARHAPGVRRIDNFGDLLGPLIVARILQRSDRDARCAPQPRRLLSVGSVLHFAQSGDVVWGSGVNGTIPEELHTFADLDVRAVRGPLTQAFLLERGIFAPAVFGDPALLLPHLFPELVAAASQKRYDLTVVPNFADMSHFARGPELLSPRAPLQECLLRIARSEFVVGSSLHAIVVAEALGIPARLIVSTAENQFKYRDYYTGSGRTEYWPAGSVAEARARGGEPPPVWDAGPLLASFPFDLWGARQSETDAVDGPQ